MNNRYAEALQVQNACNLSGVTHSLAKILSDLIRNENADTQTVASDPAVILFVDKMFDLVGRPDWEMFDLAWKVCKEKEKEPC